MPKRPLPLLDISVYHEKPQLFVEQLRHACHHVGFFLLKHDMPSDLSRRMLAESRAFFARPREQKMQISYEHSRSFRGYMPVGVENTQGKVDLREQVEYAVEYPSDGRSSSSWPVYERLKDVNPWPQSFQPSLQNTTLEYSTHVCRIADCLRDALCLALGLDDPSSSAGGLAPLFDPNSSSETTHEVPHWVVKLISYPPIDKTAEAAIDSDTQQQQQGVGAHTDTNFMTLVLQDSVGGLQAFSQGEWLDVVSSQSDDDDDDDSNSDNNVLVCNLGEQAEIWSRGYFLATPHRVVANTNDRNRISVPLFYNPILSAKIEPLQESQIKSELWERPQAYDQNQHWRRKNNAMLATVGENTFKSLARSHPKVFQRHHPDLQLTEDGRIELRK